MTILQMRQLFPVCGALLLTMAVTNWVGAQNGNGYQHVIVATQNGDVNEVYFKGGGQPIGQARLAHFDGIVAVAGYFATGDNYQHVIVATRNGDVHELYFKGGGAPIGQARLAHFDGIVAIAGYFATGDNYQHVIVATRKGDVHELYFKGGGQPIRQVRLAHFDGIVGVAGYFATGDNYQHVIVATQNGDVHELYFKGGGQPIGQARLAHFDGIVGVAGYFGSGDNYQHVIVATQNGDVNEVYFKGGGAPIGQARLAHFNSIVSDAGYFATSIGTSDLAIRYNQIQQRSIHNAYTHAESIIDQLVYYKIRNMEWDLRAQPVENIYGRRLQANDWYMYHSVHESRRCHKLSDCLKLLKAFHEAAPQHEVFTLTLEFKGADSCVNNLPTFDATAGEDPHRQTPAGLDARLREHLGAALFTPSDLLVSCPGAKHLQDAVATCGWPTLESLKGKIIVNVLAYNEKRCFQYLGRFHAYTQDALDLQYAPSESVAMQRAAFAAPLDSWWDDTRMTAKSWVVVHTEVNSPDRAIAIRANPRFSAHILRSGEANDEQSFEVAQGTQNLINTDRVTFHTYPWARTDNAQGYPFCPVGAKRTGCWLGVNETSNLAESMNRLEIEVASGDIDHEHDNFAFRYARILPPSRESSTVWTTLISSASNKGIHGWAKGCLMARENPSDSSPYYAVCVAGDNREIFTQFRSEGCQGGPCDTDHTSANPTLGVGFDAEDAHFVRLEITPLSGGGVQAQGFGSADGRFWQSIGPPRDFPKGLLLQGLAASSNETRIRNPDGTLTKFVFVNVRLNAKQITQVDLPMFYRVGNTPMASFTDRSIP